jgi:hypothetical protein
MFAVTGQVCCPVSRKLADLTHPGERLGGRKLIRQERPDEDSSENQSENQSDANRRPPDPQHAHRRPRTVVGRRVRLRARAKGTPRPEMTGCAPRSGSRNWILDSALHSAAHDRGGKTRKNFTHGIASQDDPEAITDKTYDRAPDAEAAGAHSPDPQIAALLASPSAAAVLGHREPCRRLLISGGAGKALFQIRGR